MRSHLYLKALALAKRAEGYDKMLDFDSDQINPYVQQQLQGIMPAVDSETMEALAPALKALENAEKMIGVDPSTHKAELINDFLKDTLSGGGL